MIITIKVTLMKILMIKIVIKVTMMIIINTNIN